MNNDATKSQVVPLGHYGGSAGRNDPDDVPNFPNL